MRKQQIASTISAVVFAGAAQLDYAVHASIDLLVLPATMHSEVAVGVQRSEGGLQ